MPAIASLFLLPFLFRRPESLILPVIFFGFVLLLTFAEGRTFKRYVLLVLPILAVSLSAVLIHFVRVKTLVLVISIILITASGGLYHSNNNLLRHNQYRHKNLIKKFALSLHSKEVPLHCRWRKDRDRIYPGALSYFSGLDRPYVSLRSPAELTELERQGRVSPPYRGVCNRSAFYDLIPALGSFEIVAVEEGNVLWVSPGNSSDIFDRFSGF